MMSGPVRGARGSSFSTVFSGPATSNAMIHEKIATAPAYVP
jgi:hypothetical protein